MTETLANGYSSESTQLELSYEYQQDRVWMIFRNLSILVIWTKVASALEGLHKVYYRCAEMTMGDEKMPGKKTGGPCVTYKGFVNTTAKHFRK